MQKKDQVKPPHQVLISPIPEVIEWNQPSPKFYPDGPNERFYQENKELFARSMYLISVWSKIECTFCEMYVSLIGTNRIPSAVGFLAIRQAKAQIESCTQLAKYLLHDEDCLVINKITRFYEELYWYRNYLAHGCLGFPRPVPNGSMSSTDADCFIFARATFEDFNERGFVEPYEDIYTPVSMVFREHDLVRIAKEMHSYLDVLSQANYIIGKSRKAIKNLKAAPVFGELLLLPQFETVRSHIQICRDKADKAARQSQLPPRPFVPQSIPPPQP